MLLPKFDYHEPLTINEACGVMAELDEKARPLAGGTDLIVNMKKGVLTPEHLVSLSRIVELRQIRISDDQVRIGALTTADELAESEEIGKTLTALATGAGNLGSPLIRNLATIAGNLVTARPAADLPPPLMVYGAEIILRSSSGKRSVPVDDFFTGPGETVIKSDEILTEVVVPKTPPRSGAGYIKLGVRQALEISLVNVAAYFALDDKNGSIQDAKIVLGAVAPAPIRAPSAEKVLIGERPGDILFAKAGEAAAKDSKPIDDYRGSAAYRKAMVEVLTRRTLGMAYGSLRSGLKN
jgi:carbon-monoxide dehydrogenase medium subunit